MSRQITISPLHKAFVVSLLALVFGVFAPGLLRAAAAAEQPAHEQAAAHEAHAADHHDEHGDAHGDAHSDAHAADHGDAHAADHADAHAADHSDAHAADPCAAHDHHADEHGHSAEYDPTPMILHHIGDANEWEIFHGFTIPLPVIAYVKGQGLEVFLSSRLHGGHTAYNGFIMNHGRLMRVEEPGFPSGEVELEGGGHFISDPETEKALLCYQGQAYTASRHDLVRDGFAYPWFDFSITKNVATLLLVALIMVLLFFSVAAAYKRRAGKEPRGLQAFMEPLIAFVRDNIALPNLGKNAERFMPFLMTVFFFIWIGNMVGQLPFISNPNLTGNITVTLTLALITFVLTNLNGTRSYWHHTLTAPGTPAFVKPILIPIEVFGLFTKPIALMIRLFANITAGHIIVLSLTALIFVFGKAGQSLPGSLGGAALAIPFVLFMGLIELLVAFLQAFIFTMLSALFIGMALEDHSEHH